MQGTPTERALVVLGDYLFELEIGARGGRSTYGPNRTVSERPAPAAPEEPPSAFDVAAEYAALRWEREQLPIWKKSGRITGDGRLRVRPGPLEPYTLKDVIRIMPHLNVFDRLAVLIDLDGAVKGGYLDNKAHENIKEVVERVADERIIRRLQDSDTALMLKDLIRDEISAVFGELLARVKSPVSTQGGHKSSRMHKCSKCHQPGHRATTCGRKGSELAPPADHDDDREGAAAS